MKNDGGSAITSLLEISQSKNFVKIEIFRAMMTSFIYDRYDSFYVLNSIMIPEPVWQLEPLPKITLRVY